MSLSRSSSTESLLLLAAQLHLQDVQTLNQARKGKGREDVTPADDEFAIGLYEALLVADMQVMHDHRLAMSLDRAGNLDGEALDAFVEEEMRAVRDRQCAAQLSRAGSLRSSRWGSGANSGFQSPRQPESASIFAEPSTSVTAVRSSSRSGWSSPAMVGPSQSTLTDCTACGTEFRVLLTIKAPCRHVYCHGCIVDLFKSAMADETLMPPRCCRVTIPLRSVERLLGHDTVVEFEEKLREFSTKNRLYCPQETCSAFIGEASSTKGEQVNCPKCGITVCTYCKTTSHSVWEACSDDKDPASKLVLELGEREGWRRCGGCRRLVELDHGCFHMTCLCRHQFCYVCGATWKSCTCPQWDEGRLFVAAEERVQAERNVPAIPAIRQARVQQVAEQLRVHHECQHTYGFHYDHGAGRCTWCHHRLPQYLFRCGECYIRVCNRCRRNRLF